MGVAVDPAGFVYVADSLNNRIQESEPSGNASSPIPRASSFFPMAYFWSSIEAGTGSSCCLSRAA
jgi:DNA-binding beta-propeller fold protein YncE